ncbi:Helix-turn-helix domain protein [compost metagenome]
MASVYSDEYQRVITALKNARKAQGITQAQLAEALGKPQSFIAKVENGERRLDVVEFVHLARLVNVDTCKILNEIS